MDPLQQIRDDFVQEWGALGSQWGINRTMAQIHAHLLTASHPLSTDDVMEALHISRGNAHMNLKELIQWGLVRGVGIKGERKEHFTAEKDVWTIFTCILRERHKREVEPALRSVRSCAERSAALTGEEGQALHQQLAELSDFLASASGGLERIGKLDRNAFIDLLMKRLK